MYDQEARHRMLPALTVYQETEFEAELTLMEGQLQHSRCPAWVYIKSLRVGDSQRTIRSALRSIVQIIFPDIELQEDTIYRFTWERLRYEHTAVIRSELAARYDFTTANKLITALRQVLRHAWQLELMKVEDYLRASNIKNVQGKKDDDAGRLVTKDEFARMVDVCLDDLRPQGYRDLAVLVVLYVTGIRRQELSRLNLADYISSNHALRIRGKNNKQRTVYINTDGAAAALDMWLELRGREQGPLFCPIERGGHVGRVGKKVRRKGVVDARPLARLTPEGIYDVFVIRAEQVLTDQDREEGLKPARPHDMRRSMISTYFESNVDVAIMRRLTGHAKVDTLVGYDRRPGRAAEKAAKVITLPDVLRESAGVPASDREGQEQCL